MHTAETHDGTETSRELPSGRSGRAWLERITGPRGGLMLAMLALVLTLPALRLGFMTDDRAFADKFRRGDGPLVVYSMTTAEIAAGRESGMFPWWTSPNFRLKFFRPLTSLTHQLDYQAWPDAPWAMHLINAALYAAIVLVAFVLYRELLPSRPLVAALASLMFAIDDGHATAAGWISSRSMLLSSLFGLSSVLLRAKTRARPAPALRVASVGCLALSLFSAESGLSTLAYLGAYALTFERGSLVRRVATLLPELIVFAVWAVVYVSGHYGAQGLSLYRELSSPLTVLGQGLMDVPAWLLILLGPSLVDSLMMQALVVARVIGALLCLPLLTALISALPRTREQAFFALGSLLCLPPLFSTLPQDRLLIMASFGAFGLLASFLAAVRERVAPPRWLRATRGVFIGLHLVLAPLLFVPALGQNQLVDKAAAAVAEAVPATPPRQVLVVNTPVEILNLYAWQQMLEQPNRQVPETFAQLYAGSSSVAVRRIDPHTLELRPEHGWGSVPIERVFSKLADLPRAGQHIRVSGMEVSVEETTPDGRPARVQFRFPTPLEATDRLWMAWQGTRPVAWQPPAVGEEVTLAPLGLLNLIQP